MTTVKELFGRRAALHARISVYEEVLSAAYDVRGLKEKYGDDAVDSVLTEIDEICLTPLRAELEKIDGMEVDGGINKPKKAAKRRKKRASSTGGGAAN